MARVIAERRFVRKDGAFLSAEIEAPQPIDEGRSFVCRYRVRGRSESLERDIGGVDAFQALILAVQVLEAELTTIRDNEDGGQLRWEYSTLIGDLGPWNK